jgi:hypothetical protein
MMKIYTVVIGGKNVKIITSDAKAMDTLLVRINGEAQEEQPKRKKKGKRNE